MNLGSLSTTSTSVPLPGGHLQDDSDQHSIYHNVCGAGGHCVDLTGEVVNVHLHLLEAQLATQSLGGEGLQLVDLYH